MKISVASSTAALLVSAIALGGCVLDDAVTSVQAAFATPAPVIIAQVDPASLSGPNSIPWQLTPASSASIAQGEVTVVADKPGVGRVRGTEKALAQLDQRIVPFTKSGRVVSACKDTFDSQAKQAGAYSVEAAAAGPERKVAKGRSQQVFFRIFYADPKDSGVEVRQASIACTMGANGHVVEAAVI